MSHEPPADAIADLQLLLDRAEDAVLALGNGAGWQPRPGSTEDLDRRDARFAPIGEVAPHEWGFAQACLLQLRAAGNHFQALSRVLADPPPVYAIPVLSRASLEASSRVSWLSDPNVGRRDRAARRAQEMLSEIRWLKRRNSSQAEEHLKQLAQWLEQANLETQLDGEGHVSKIQGEPPPRISELIRALTSGDGLLYMWEDAAQTAHGRITGLRRYAHLRPSTEDSRIGEWSHEIEWWQVSTLVAAPVLVFLQAADRMAQIAGWDNSPWRHQRDPLRRQASGLIESAAWSRRQQ